MASGTINLGQSKNTMGRIVWESEVNGTNSSKVTASIQVRKSSDTTEGTTGTWAGALNIGGTTKDFSYYGTIYQSWITLLSFYVTKTHNADGTGSCYISGQINAPSGTTQAGASVYGNDTVTLDYIPKQAIITSAPNFNDEDNPTIKYSNPAGSAATTLEACISLNGAADDIAYRDISKSGNSYTFNLTTAERNILRNATANAKSRTVRFYVKSVVNGISYLSYLEKTLSIVNANPTVSGTVEDTNSVTLALTGDKNKLVKYHSNAKYSMTATANKGATITSRQVTNGSKTFTATSGTINNVESQYFNFTATDSRGNSKTANIAKTLVGYIKLTCNFGANKIDTSGNLTFTVKGNYFNSSFGATNNTLQVFYRYKDSFVGDFSEWASMAVTLNGNTYTATANVTGLDYQTTYYFQAYAIDKLETVYTEETPLKSNPVFDWSETDFNLNVNMNIKNKTVLRSNGENNNIILSAEDAADGIFIRPNGTGSSTGQTIFYKDGTVRMGGVVYGKARQLWSGGWYMTEGHTAQLSQLITDQPNGLVLVFSRNGLDSDWNCFFVPKEANYPLMQYHNFILVDNSYNIGFKTLEFVGNNSIRGVANNNKSGTAPSGIKYNNALFVLRYVYGV